MQKLIQTPLFHGLEMQPHLASLRLFPKKKVYSNLRRRGTNPVKNISSEYKVKFENGTDL